MSLSLLPLFQCLLLFLHFHAFLLCQLSSQFPAVKLRKKYYACFLSTIALCLELIYSLCDTVCHPTVNRYRAQCAFCFTHLNESAPFGLTIHAGPTAQTRPAVLAGPPVQTRHAVLAGPTVQTRPAMLVGPTVEIDLLCLQDPLCKLDLLCLQNPQCKLDLLCLQDPQCKLDLLCLQGPLCKLDLLCLQDPLCYYSCRVYEIHVSG